MVNRAREAGPTAGRVAENVRALRRLRGLELSSLAARLDELGQPIGVPGLSRLENGERRVDVDDLLALSVALDVTPLRLLLTATATDQVTEVMPGLTLEEKEAWEWAVGIRPLLAVGDWSSPDSVGRADRFKRENQPQVDHDERLDTEQIVNHLAELTALSLAAKTAVDAGLSWGQVHGYIEFVRTAGPLHDYLVQGEQRRQAEAREAAAEAERAGDDQPE